MGVPGRIRRRTIRFKIFGLLLVPVASMMVLWVVIVAVTTNDSLQLRAYGTIWSTLRVPADELIVELQQERLAAARFLGEPRSRREMVEQRPHTDRAVATFRRLAQEQEAAGTVTPAMRKQLDDLLNRVSQLGVIRADIDAGLTSRIRAIEAYNAISDAAFRMHRSLALINDLPIYQQSLVVIDLAYSKELLTREQALAAGMLPSGQAIQAERRLFTQIVGNRRFLIDKSLAELDPELRAYHVNLITSPEYQRLRILEEAVIAGRTPSFTQWHPISDELARAFQQAQEQAGARLAERAVPIADDVLARAVLLAGVGLGVVVITILITLRLGSRLSDELAALRRAAQELAQVRLPNVMQKLRRGERVDVEVEAPPISTKGSTAEVKDVEEAFSAVQHTAIEAAVGQAELRAGVNQVFLNLARRSQALLHRQRIQLDGMQRRATDPGALDDLFRLDHLTTRMRRHAEGLIILSGAVPGRGWRKPIPMLDVVRGAAAEVEDYARVNVQPMSDHALIGAAVGDVIHLIAELIENATVYSPPHTSVTVRGEMVGNGFAVEVEDRGLGLPPEVLAEFNERLANPPEFDLADSDRLGLFVVGRLAARHNIRVTLRPSPYGGTTAIVLIPIDLVSMPEAPDSPDGLAPVTLIPVDNDANSGEEGDR
ncbi:nitrate- and nitrite sensing domain-containing protein [Thermopolyspora sp. NPDC052614]|uniref:sensor histidine kinase n=1 Tax=Thermopolyspora sp. NPDC052614 TaxID=3155682 RepID=UPI0034126B31